jgi:hypothetical protein
VATYVPSSANLHMPDAFGPTRGATRHSVPKVITRAHVTCSPVVEDKDIPELLLALSLWKRRFMKSARADRSGGNILAMGNAVVGV